MNEIIITEKKLHSIFAGFLESLLSVADKEEQKKAWIGGDYSSYVDFSEVFMRFFGTCESILTWPELSNMQRKNLQKLYDMLENYDDYLPDRKKTDKEICNDPEWIKIREFAQQVYDDLKHVKYIPEESS